MTEAVCLLGQPSGLWWNRPILSRLRPLAGRHGGRPLQDWVPFLANTHHPCSGGTGIDRHHRGQVGAHARLLGARGDGPPLLGVDVRSMYPAETIAELPTDRPLRPDDLAARALPALVRAAVRRQRGAAGAAAVVGDAAVELPLAGGHRRLRIMQLRRHALVGAAGVDDFDLAARGDASKNPWLAKLWSSTADLWRRRRGATRWACRCCAGRPTWPPRCVGRSGWRWTSTTTGPASAALLGQCAEPLGGGGAGAGGGHPALARRLRPAPARPLGARSGRAGPERRLVTSSRPPCTGK